MPGLKDGCARRSETRPVFKIIPPSIYTVKITNLFSIRHNAVFFLSDFPNSHKLHPSTWPHFYCHSNDRWPQGHDPCPWSWCPSIALLSPSFSSCLLLPRKHSLIAWPWRPPRPCTWDCPASAISSGPAAIRVSFFFSPQVRIYFIPLHL
jgi:hypothetical protein